MNIIKHAQSSCYMRRYICTISHSMDRIWLLLVPIETEVDPQLLQPKYVVIQWADQDKCLSY